MYMKAVVRSAAGIYHSMVDFDVHYEVGNVVAARCNRYEHPAPQRDCGCGIYSVRLSMRGLARLDHYVPLPPRAPFALLAVEPVGRAYDDGLIVRSERVLVLGVLDWDRLVPPQFRDLSDREFQQALSFVHTRPRNPYALAHLRHVMGRGCYPLERMRRIAARYGCVGHTGRCPFCATLERSLESDHGDERP